MGGIISLNPDVFYRLGCGIYYAMRDTGAGNLPNAHGLLYRGYQYRDNGKENGNDHNVLYNGDNGLGFRD